MATVGEAGAGEAAAAPDPYATARANLRDTVKWLAATFSALAAVVMVGSPVSGLGKLPPFTAMWWGAALALAVAFLCICLALVITVSLLRSDVLHLSDLGPNATLAQLSAADRKEIGELRRAIDERAVDVLPANYPTLARLMQTAHDRRTALADAAEAQRMATDPGAKDAARQRIERAQERMSRFVPVLTRVGVYAGYVRFYDRLRRAMPKLFALGVLALAGLTAYGVLVQPSDKAEVPRTVIINNIAASSPAAAPPLPALAPVRFATGQALLTTEGLALVEAARAALLAYPQSSLLLYAHTDTVSGVRANAPLARRRAATVRRALVNEGGVDPTRIFFSELPETSLPELTAQETANEANRAVLLKLVIVPR